MPTIIRQEDPAYFKIVGTVLTVSDALAAKINAAVAGRTTWPAALYGHTTTTSTVIAQVPWVALDNTAATAKQLHLRAVLSVSDNTKFVELTVTSQSSGLDLTINDESGNVFRTNGTIPTTKESNVDLFQNDISVFDPLVDDILTVTLKATGGATARCDYAEFILVAPA